MSPHLTLNPSSDLSQLLEYRFMVNALLAAGAVAVMASAVGWLMVLRRETFAGHTLSMMAFPGAAAAALAGAPLAAGYFAFCGLGALAIALIPSNVRHGRDARQEAAIIGTVGAGALATGFLLLNLYHGVLESLESLLFGSILGVTRPEVVTLAIVAACVLAILVVVGRPLLFTSIDPVLARSKNVPVQALNVGFLLVLGFAVAATAQITGVLLVFALLVAPAGSARELTPRVGLGLALSIAFGIAIAWIGLSLSYFSEYPPGFYVSTLAIVLFACARGRRALLTRRALVGRR